MNSLVFVGLLALCAGLTVANDPHGRKKVVCYWNTPSFYEMGPDLLSFDHLILALPYCTHLIYGWVGLDLPIYGGMYKVMTRLKKDFPGLKIYLGVGGKAAPYTDAPKYLTLIETPEARWKFFQSALEILKFNGFDGIDLAWPFPTDRVDSDVAGKKTEHRLSFGTLVRSLKNRLELYNLTVTVTVLPYINASVYYEPKLLAENLDAVHLMAFDQTTPKRNPTEADYPAPIEARHGSAVQADIESAVNFWVSNETPRDKIVIGIPTYGRTWRLTSESATDGVPPFLADGPGAAGSFTKTPGMLSYGEICARFRRKSVNRVRRVADPTGKYGSYGFAAYNKETGADGIWIGYEDPETAANKAVYAKTNNLGGVAIYDLSTDDFGATCTPDSFPILRAANYKLKM